MKIILVEADSEASRHYIKNDKKGVLIYIKPATNKVVNIPNNKVMTSSFKGQIPEYSVLSD